ncbi:MAG TPA: hypothetical protein VF062_12495 [Candidatus Limnocylindrales bacterium]
MSIDQIQPPTLMPLLSRGKHRSPRSGACFMEMASLLAGQRWSDHPACTHPLLAALARYVNDYTSDAGRQRLAPLIPSVIGLTSDDLRVDARIALRCATTALPVVSADRQRALAVAILATDRVLADLDGRSPGTLEERSSQALAKVPHAEKWAEQFTARLPMTPKAFRRRSAPSIVGCAVVGIAQACTPDPNSLLRDLLAAAIDDFRAETSRRSAQPAEALTH